MLDDINELANYITEIMKFYYSTMFKNLNDLCFLPQVNNFEGMHIIIIL